VVYSVVDNYDWLVNGTAQVQVDTFIEEDHSFDEYTKVRIMRMLSVSICETILLLDDC